MLKQSTKEIFVFNSSLQCLTNYGVLKTRNANEVMSMKRVAAITYFANCFIFMCIVELKLYCISAITRVKFPNSLGSRLHLIIFQSHAENWFQQIWYISYMKGLLLYWGLSFLYLFRDNDLFFQRKYFEMPIKRGEFKIRLGINRIYYPRLTIPMKGSLI